MKKILSVMTVICFSMIFSIPAFAQDPNPKTPVVRKRQQNQHKRVRQGVKSGEVTQGEAKRIQNNQSELNQDKKEAKSDGVVTGAERRELHREQNKNSRQIYRLKHNRRDRN